MSYIRLASILRWVDAESSKDYVFPTDDGKGNIVIEDYGKISDEGIIELLFRWWKTEDAVFKYHLLKRLADRLGVKLRKRPLTEKEIDKLYDRQLKETRKKMKKWFKDENQKRT